MFIAVIILLAVVVVLFQCKSEANYTLQQKNTRNSEVQKQLQQKIETNSEIMIKESRYGEIKEIEKVCERNYSYLYSPRVYQDGYEVVICGGMGPLYGDYFTSEYIKEQRHVLPLLKAIKKIAKQAYKNGRNDYIKDIEDKLPKKAVKTAKKKVVNK